MLGHNIYCCGVLVISDSKNGDWRSVTLDQQVCHNFLVNYICNTEDEVETLYNPTQFKDEEKVSRLELKAADMTVLSSKGKVQDGGGIVMLVMSSDEHH